MADQATVNRAAALSNGAAPEGVVESIAEFVNDVTTLADLQMQLALHESRDMVGRALYPAIAVAAAVGVALASLCVTLFGLSHVVARSLGLRAEVGELLVGVTSLVVAGIVGFVGYKAVLGSLSSYGRTREELARNIAWLRTVIVHSGRPATRRKA